MDRSWRTEGQLYAVADAWAKMYSEGNGDPRFIQEANDLCMYFVYYVLDILRGECTESAARSVCNILLPCLKDRARL